MRIVDIPEFRDKKDLLSFDRRTSLLKVVQEMSKKNFGAVPITEQGRLVGIFSERDLMRKVIAKKKKVESLRVEDVMTENVRTASPEDNVVDCLRKMSQGRFRHMPVVNKKGELLGMISQGDFVAVTWNEILHRVTTQTRASLGAHTQLWLMLAVVLIYITIMVVLLGYDSVKLPKFL